MQGLGEKGLEPAIEAFDLVTGNCKSFILKGARVVNSRKAFEGAAMFGELAAAWERGIAGLRSALAVP